jgi:pimeloyl-ACP methyl ester carboxylesterase
MRPLPRPSPSYCSPSPSAPLAPLRQWPTPRRVTSRPSLTLGGGRRLYIECRGTGSPVVVLEAGYRSSARIWSEDLHQSGAPRPMVLAGVAAFTRVCAYDRPGTVALLNDNVRQSRSDPVAMPRTALDAVADLHALLRAAGVPGSYVFAGHSLGGLLVRLYASTYPRDVLRLG